jgi:hypothetical protein
MGERFGGELLHDLLYIAHFWLKSKLYGAPMSHSVVKFPQYFQIG